MSFNAVIGFVKSEYKGSEGFAAGWKELIDKVAADPEGALGNRYRHMVETLCQPNNEELLRLIQENYHLLDSMDMPDCFLELAQHVAELEYIISRWKVNDFAKMRPSIPYPPSLTTWAYNETKRLKAVQNKLLAYEFHQEDSGRLEIEMHREEANLRHQILEASKSGRAPGRRDSGSALL